MGRPKRAVCAGGLAAGLFFAGVVAGTPALAQVLPPLDLHALYEEQLIGDTLHQLGLEPDPAPLGKTIERIEVTTHDIFLSGVDPVPTFFNNFHITTQRYIVSQEVLFQVGDVIGPDTLAETERNLRGFFILAVTRIVTAKGSSPDKVIVVVVTKDLWSLRPNTNFSYVNGHLNLLSFTLAEHNVAGRNKRFGVTWRLDPVTYLLGEQYSDPRIWGTRVAASEAAQVTFNREDNSVEGVSEAFGVGQPLYSLSTEWAWGANVSFTDAVARQIQNGDVQLIQLPSGAVTAYQYRARIISAGVSAERSFGLHWKSNLTAGYAIHANRYTSLDPLTSVEFAQYRLPISEESAQLFARYDFFRATYATFQNVNTFAFTEDLRTGPSATVEVDWAASQFGFSSDFVHIGSGIGYVWIPGGDIVSFSVTGDVRYWNSLANPFPSLWVNRIFTAGISNITPRFAGGAMRLVTKAYVQIRDFDSSRSVQQLGGTNGLRGFPDGEFSGQDLFVANAELRTKPLAIWTVYAGLVAFYDGGSVFTQGAATTTTANMMASPNTYHQDVGIGARFLFPQFNHDSVRVDLAFPIAEASPSYGPAVLTAAFGQAF